MRTALYDRHLACGAKMVDFAGWEMPIQYQGIVQEHKAVRAQAGIFDVSHMGRVLISGKDAATLLDYLSTNHIADRDAGTATYTVWCDENGYCIDDLIVYKLDSEAFFVVFNAGNRQKDLDHLNRYAKGYEVSIADRYREDGILAVQGPRALPLIAKIFPDVLPLKPMHVTTAPYNGTEVAISTTGYTGAGGVEIYASNGVIVDLWDAILHAGQADGVVPVGLGARDTLRLEMGYALYGHELSPEIAPTESVAAWTVKWDKPDFLGKQALQRLKMSPVQRRQYGIELKDKGIAREGYAVHHRGEIIGKITSGTMSPSLQRPIALMLVERRLQQGDSVEVAIRQNLCRAEVVSLPFYKPPR